MTSQRLVPKTTVYLGWPEFMPFDPRDALVSGEGQLAVPATANGRTSGAYWPKCHKTDTTNLTDRVPVCHYKSDFMGTVTDTTRSCLRRLGWCWWCSVRSAGSENATGSSTGCTGRTGDRLFPCSTGLSLLLLAVCVSVTYVLRVPAD